MRKTSNSSRYRGVYWVKRDECWRSKITVNDVMIVLGNFTDELAAARAYDAAARQYHKDFAVLNIYENEEDKQ